jgi:hypothetical protein
MDNQAAEEIMEFTIVQFADAAMTAAEHHLTTDDD